MTNKSSPLNLPEVEPAQFEKNFIKTAVCELRFPALLEFEKNQLGKLQHELRKEFPNYEKQQSFSLLNPEEKEMRHLLTSRKKEWIVSIRTYSIAVQTDRYTHFGEFSAMANRVFAKALPLLDTDFFTRVGLRYINEIRIEDGEVAGWINEDLIAPIAHGIYCKVDRFMQEVRGTGKTGQFTFRHGIAGPEEAKRDIYIVDFDFYNENVQAEAVAAMMSDFNREAFQFFRWAMGPKAMTRLGKPMTREDKS